MSESQAATSGSNKNKREFHDAWAFIMFVIFSVGMNTLYFMKSPDSIGTIKSFSDKYKITACFFSNLGFTITLLLAALLLCFFIPKVLIIISVLTVPIFSVYAFFAFDLGSHEFGKIFAIGLFIFNLIFIVIAGIVILSHLNYFAVALKVSAGIFFENFLGIFIVQILCLLTLVVSLVPVFLVDSNDEIIKILRYVIILQIAWLSAILSYFVQVFISSVVFFHVKQNDESVFVNSLTNSCYALGSISFGALLMAIITTLQAMINNAKAEQHRNKTPNVGATIALAILKMFVEILGDVVKCANALAFPYLSVNGTGYTESVIKSFELVTSSGYEKIAAFMGIDFIVFTMFLTSAISTWFFNFSFLFKQLSVSVDGLEKLIFIGIITFIFSNFFSMVFYLLKSAVLALIFSAATSHAEVEAYSPEFTKVIEEEKNKTQSADTNREAATS